MRKRIIIIASLFFIVGTTLILFPFYSNFIGKQIAKGEIAMFDTIVENIADGSFNEALKKGKVDEESYPVDKNGKRTSNYPVYFKIDIDRLYKDSVKYNENLKDNQRDLLVNKYSYINPSLDLTKYGIFNGIYGYISAPVIDMQLPIYLGANDTNMSCGAAHLTYTSLPIGGKSTNTVLAAHTGYIGRILFDNIRKLQIGDEIVIKNYWSTLKYNVIKTKSIKPNESADIYIDEDKDLLTLITCISNGSGGFNRYIVICEQIGK